MGMDSRYHVILSETKDLAKPWDYSTWAQILRRWLRMTTWCGLERILSHVHPMSEWGNLSSYEYRDRALSRETHPPGV